MFGRYISFINRWNITIFVFQCQCGLLWFCWCNVIMSCIMCNRNIFNWWRIQLSFMHRTSRKCLLDRQCHIKCMSMGM